MYRPFVFPGGLVLPRKWEFRLKPALRTMENGTEIMSMKYCRYCVEKSGCWQARLVATNAATRMDGFRHLLDG